jgi:hypothetical protein
MRQNRAFRTVRRPGSRHSKLKRCCEKNDMGSEKRPDDNYLAAYVRKAIALGVSQIEMEYENGREHIFAVTEHLAVEIDSLESMGEKARALRELLCDIATHPRRLRIGTADYRLTVTTYESFGEDVFRISIRQA